MIGAPGEVCSRNPDLPHSLPQIGVMQSRSLIVTVVVAGAIVLTAAQPLQARGLHGFGRSGLHGLGMHGGGFGRGPGRLDPQVAKTISDEHERLLKKLKDICRGC
ncbi:hypothetical protein [Rhodopseudomonas sp. B29]|uniref:hypothetical protein n=1 Tax=Rhodopseudomonas sp. B29 TaxID=95607 RepID=UPI0003B51473|nr:hypothetical protein [Rhodopseudomonas sp. B29]